MTTHETETARLHAAIDHIASLPANWDSYGAMPASQQAIDHLRAAVPHIVAAEFDPPPSVDMDSDGQPVLLWDDPGFGLIVTVRDDGSAKAVWYSLDEDMDIKATSRIVPPMLAMARSLLAAKLNEAFTTSTDARRPNRD